MNAELLTSLVGGGKVRSMQIQASRFGKSAHSQLAIKEHHSIDGVLLHAQYTLKLQREAYTRPRTHTRAPIHMNAEVRSNLFRRGRLGYTMLQRSLSVKIGMEPSCAAVMMGKCVR